MRRAKIVWILAMACPGTVTLAEEPALIQQQAGDEVSISDELRALYDADQRDRREGLYGTAELTERDGQRRARVDELLRAEGLQTGSDFFHAAMIYQHGTEADDFVIASVLATAAGSGDTDWAGGWHPQPWTGC